ncbi:UNVERIFIED_ORG: MFS transporter [Bacillus sp. AZ43]
MSATGTEELPGRGRTVGRLLRRGDFRRLLGTRLLGQFGDGVLQAALAGTVLFNPQRAADPVDVAAAFAMLLLPYSLVGPFAGVWLDRWSRRQVLLVANLVRAVLVTVLAGLVLGGVTGVAFAASGLAVVSVNRFVLSALSAGLPHTTEASRLVPANALSTTAGTVATVAGGGAALLLLQLTGPGDAGYATVTVATALPYLAAAAVVAGFSRDHLGPDAATASARATARETFAGLVAGLRHVADRPPAAAALLVIGVHRLCFGVLTLMTLLLYRNTFPAGGGAFPGGMVGLGQTVAAGAAGALLAAVLTPPAVARLGTARWVVLLLACCGPAQLALGLPFTPAGVVLAAFVLSFVGQGVKICVDTTLQESAEDDYRGRVFSVYDTLVNVTYVVALVAGAFVLPPSGVSATVLAVVAAGYLATALALARAARSLRARGRSGPRPAPPAR